MWYIYIVEMQNFAPLAQLVEHLTLNQGVRGSSPRWCTIRLVGQAVKTLASHAGNMGSIPIRVTSFHLFKEIFDLPIDFIFCVCYTICVRRYHVSYYSFSMR